MGKKELCFISASLFLLILLVFLNISNVTLLYDDVFSIFLIKKSFLDVARITVSDVHPPLYYWMLKLNSLIFGSTLLSLRMFSLFGVVATILLGYFPVRRIFGNKVAFFFITLLLIFPVTQCLIADIRMYSWTMFFVLSCALSAYQVYQEGDFKSWVLFFITGVSAAYLHNYGLLSVFGIYIILFISFIRGKRRLQSLFICSFLFLVSYLPWLLQLFGQINAISGNYWIKPLTLKDLFLHIYYFYSPKEIWLPFTDFSKLQMMVALILLMIIQFIITLKVLKESYKKDQKAKLAVLSFVSFLVPVLIGAMISLAYMPVLVTRYMTCSFGLFVLSLAFILAKSYDYPFYRKLTLVFVFLLFLDGGIRFYSNLKYYNRTETAYSQIRDFIDGENSGKLVINDFSYHVMPRLQIVAPGNEYYVLTENGDRNNFEPFVFDEINKSDLSFDKFILVHQEREAIQQYFRQYQQSISNIYTIVDSLHASDIYLYQMQRID